MIHGLTPRVVAGAAALLLILPASLSAQLRRSAEPFTWSGTLPPGGTIEVKGVNGPVRAVAASGSTVRAEALRSARRSDPSEVRLEVVEHAGGVTICAVYPSSRLRAPNECAPGDGGRLEARNNDTNVAFTVEVPAGTGFVGRTANGDVTTSGLSGDVRIRSTNGDVEIDGGRTVVARTTNGSVDIRAAGDASAHSTNGRIEARLERLTGTELDFATTNGSIAIALPTNANLNVTAATTNGRIDSDLPVTITSMSRSRLEGVLGAGGADLKVRTTNGSIRLERVD